MRYFGKQKKCQQDERSMMKRFTRRSREVFEILKIRLVRLASRRKEQDEQCEMPAVVTRRKSEVLRPVRRLSVPRRNQFSVDIPGNEAWSSLSDVPIPSIDELSTDSNTGFEPENLVFRGLVGRGAHGTVHKADFNGATVAVKIVNQSERQEGSSGALSVAPELELLQGILHPNLVEIYGVHGVAEEFSRSMEWSGSEERSSFDSDIFGSPCHMDKESSHRRTSGLSSQTWIVMEYCDRGSLWDAIQMGEFSIGVMCGAPHYSKIMQVGLEIAFGMRHLHKLGIIHGDLKAQNIILQSSPSSQKKFIAKICDFGLCRRPEDDRLDLTTFSWGTVDHMAPETLQNGKLHAPTDVFSFAILLLEMMTGAQPFHSMTTPAVIVAIVQGLRPKIPQTCPPGLASLIQDCWEQNWRKRPTFKMIVSRFMSIML